MRILLPTLGLLALLPHAQGQSVTEHCGVSVLAPTQASTLCPSNVAGDASRALDLSGGVGSGTYYVSLCGSDSCSVTLGVTVIDGAGPDLQVEEVNPNSAEPYLVEVSPDGSTWFPLTGPYAGGTCAGDVALDLAGSGTASANHVRLTGASPTLTGSTPGPDIDAVIAINYLPPLFAGAPHPYAGAVVSYNQGVTLTSPYLDPTRALGPPDAYRTESFVGPGTTTFSGAYWNFVSLGQGAILVLTFTNDWIIDGPGADFAVHEYYSPEGNQFTVEVSDDGVHWVPATLIGSVSPAYGTGQPVTNNVQTYDLLGSGLLFADFVRLVSTATSGAGTTPGAELDAVEAIWSAPKARRLVIGTPLTAGGIGTIDLTAAGHVGELAIVAPAATPPLAAGAGLPLGPGIEFRLDLSDPILNFVLFDPLAAFLVSGNVAGIPASPPTATTTVTLPSDPTLPGLVLYWHAALLGSGGVPTGVSNILHARIQ